MITACRIALLPQWAQRYILGLEKRIDGAEFSTAAGAVNTVTLTRREMAAAEVTVAQLDAALRRSEA